MPQPAPPTPPKKTTPAPPPPPPLKKQQNIPTLWKTWATRNVLGRGWWGQDLLEYTNSSQLKVKYNNDNNKAPRFVMAKPNLSILLHTFRVNFRFSLFTRNDCNLLVNC